MRDLLEEERVRVEEILLWCKSKRPVILKNNSFEADIREIHLTVPKHNI